MVRYSLELTPDEPVPVAFVTGGARRVGAHVARAFHHAGYRVVVHYRASGEAADTLVAELNRQRPDSARAIASTLATPTDIERCAGAATAAFGRLDVLVNNASSFFPTHWGDIDSHRIRTLLHSNLELPMLMTQSLVEELSRHAGSVINMVDIHALRPLANHAVYNAAKAGLISLTQSTALDLAPGIRANAIAPGAILLPENEGEDYARKLAAEIPLGRLGSPDDIARAALFLAGSPYITGQVLVVDGGRSLRQ